MVLGIVIEYYVKNFFFVLKLAVANAPVPATADMNIKAKLQTNPSDHGIIPVIHFLGLQHSIWYFWQNGTFPFC